MDKVVTHHVNSGGRQAGVHDDTFPRLCDTNEPFRLSILFSHQRGDVGFESPSSSASDDHGEDKQSNGCIATYDPRDGGNDHNDMTNHGDRHAHTDGLIAAPVRICNVGAGDRSHIRPVQNGHKGCDGIEWVLLPFRTRIDRRS